MSRGHQDAGMAHRAPVPGVEETGRADEAVSDMSRSPSSTRRSPATTARRPQNRERPSERDAFLAAIVRSKVQPTPVRAQTLARARLLDRLRSHVDDRLTLIVAEAGFGKTTLLADFARRDVVRCLWYKLESSDGDWVTFIN